MAGETATLADGYSVDLIEMGHAGMENYGSKKLLGQQVDCTFNLKTVIILG